MESRPVGRACAVRVCSVACPLSPVRGCYVEPMSDEEYGLVMSF